MGVAATLPELSEWTIKLVESLGDHFNFVCTGVCGHTIGKLIHPQTKVGLSIKKNRPIPRLCTIKHEPNLTKLQLILFNFTKTTHSQVELLKWRSGWRSYVSELWPIRRFLGRNLHPSQVFRPRKLTHSGRTSPSMTQNCNWSAPSPGIESVTDLFVWYSSFSCISFYVFWCFDRGHFLSKTF